MIALFALSFNTGCIVNVDRTNNQIIRLTKKSLDASFPCPFRIIIDNQDELLVGDLQKGFIYRFNAERRLDSAYYLKPHGNFVDTGVNVITPQFRGIQFEKKVYQLKRILASKFFSKDFKDDNIDFVILASRGFPIQMSRDRDPSKPFWFQKSYNSLYLSDASEQVTAVFDLQGNHLFEFGSIGNVPGKFLNPGPIAITPDREIFLIDTGREKIIRYNSAGVFQSEWELPQLGSVLGGASCLGNGQIALLDYSKHIIHQFDPSNGKWNVFPASIKGISIKACTMASDKSGNLYVTNGSDWIYAFNPEGLLLGKSRLPRDWDLNVLSIAVDGQGDPWILDGHKRKVFSVEGIGRLTEKTINHDS